MKNKAKNLIIVLILFIFSCESENRLEGSFNACNPEFGYLEMYFKKDSMRIATNDNKISLSKWRKIKFKNDTLYFETFGEWRDSSKAKVNFLENKRIQFIYDYIRVTDTQYFNRMNNKINFDDPILFWNRFKIRKDNCLENFTAYNGI